ncbi:MAG: hypothetical protein QM499_00550 [Flavobacteriaceae bacterium]
MKINQSTYQLANFRNLKKVIFSSLFLVFLVTNPIVQLISVIEDVKYELVDASEKEETSKQETVSELENETKFLQINNAISFQKALKKQISYFIVQPSFLTYKKDIQLPPPRVI